MNDLDLVREFRAELEGRPSRARLDASWDRLRDRLDRRRPARRWPVAAAVAVVTAAVVFAVTALLPSGAGGPKRAAAVSFSTSGQYIVAVITDPAADAATLRQAFAEHGLDISLRLVPVSPSLVGKVVEEDGSGIETLYDPNAPCTTPGGSSCPIGLRVPLDFEGQASITMGRAASDGETYVSANDAYAFGEALHCSGLRGMTVRHAVPVLARLGVAAIWRSMDQATDRAEGIDPATIADQYVSDAVPAAPGQVYIWAAPDPPPTPEPGTPLAGYFERLNRGC